MLMLPHLGELWIYNLGCIHRINIVVYTPCIHGETILESQEGHEVDMDTSCVGFAQRYGSSSRRRIGHALVAK